MSKLVEVAQLWLTAHSARSKDGDTFEKVELLASWSRRLLASDDVDHADAVTYPRLRTELAAQTAHATVHPVFLGSAITGAGVDALMAGLVELLPAAEGDAAAPASGRVFKIERGAAGEKLAYVRMFAGIVHVRDRVPIGLTESGKVTAVHVFEGGAWVARTQVRAGQIGRLWGLAGVRVGDPASRRGPGRRRLVGDVVAGERPIEQLCGVGPAEPRHRVGPRRADRGGRCRHRAGVVVARSNGARPKTDGDVDSRPRARAVMRERQDAGGPADARRPLAHRERLADR